MGYSHISILSSCSRASGRGTLGESTKKMGNVRENGKNVGRESRGNHMRSS